MINLLDKFSGRNTSSFKDLSVGTGLALEALFDITEESINTGTPIVKTKEIYTHLGINLHTLIRNIFNANTHNEKLSTLLMSSSVNPTNVLDTLSSELSTIYDLTKDTKMTLFLYFPDYNDYINKLTDKNKIKNMSSNMLIMSHRVRELIKNKGLKGLDITEAIIYDNSLRSISSNGIQDKKVILLTNNILDSFSEKYTNKLDFLSSHTGEILSKYEYNKKYKRLSKHNWSNIPVYERLLRIIGDDNIVNPMSVKIRRSLIDVATRNNWTTMTTEDKVKYDIRQDEILFSIYNYEKEFYGK